MGNISASIELYDRISAPLQSMINSMNMVISQMYTMQNAMGADIDTSSIDSARDSIAQAGAAIHLLRDNARPIDIPVEVGHVETPNIGSIPPVEVPVRMGNLEAPPTPDIPPVEVPVEWQVPQTVEIFTNTGIDRFKNEVQSADQMVRQLVSSQTAIAQNAINTRVFSPSALSDISALGTRINAIQQKINDIQTHPLDFGDRANNQLEQLRSQLNEAVIEQNELNTAIQNMDVGAANDAYARLQQTIGNTERYIRDNITEQNNWNEAIRTGENNANGLVGMIKTAIATYATINSIKGVMDASDELTATKARVDMMNGAFNKMNNTAMQTPELVNMIYRSAQDARGLFGDMAAVVAKFGNNARDAFANQNEVVAFANLVQKEMTIAGASTTEASNAMLQLSQALGSGALRGDELNSIFEQAPNLIQTIADYMEVPIGKIKDMAKDGKLTADIVKNAIMSSADDINKQFAEMPMTWNQVWTRMQNTALMAFEPVLAKVNELANSAEFQQFSQNAIDAMAALANAVLETFDIMAQIATFINDNWGMISPIVYGAVAAIIAYNTIMGISAAITTAHAMATGIMTTAQAIYTAATAAAATGQSVFNAVLAACPITWIVMAVVALVAAIIAFCQWIAQSTDAANTWFGVLMGGLAAVGAAFYNTFLGVLNIVFAIINAMSNHFATFANFLANVFVDPIGAIIHLFEGMAQTVLSILAGIARAIDSIFGSNLASAVSEWSNSLSSKADALAAKYGNGDYTEVFKGTQLSAADLGLERIDYGDAFKAGASWGDGVANKVSGMFNFSGAGTSLGGGYDVSDAIKDLDYHNNAALDDIGNSANRGANAAEKAANEVDISNENLRYLRDLAETTVINKITMPEITINQTNNNSVSGAMDVDTLIAQLTDGVNEAMLVTAEGVHE